MSHGCLGEKTGANSYDSILHCLFSYNLKSGSCFWYREDFERIGLSSLVTVGIQDIQGEGFPDEFCGAVDSVFLDLPQPWLAIPSAGKMLKQDGILCSFSPCIEQVQRSCESLRMHFTGKFAHELQIICIESANILV